ncbi:MULTISPECIES: hypothetical protein [unclassified Brevibacterium]|uniref:hypothetical protein n=1 Tax=unclassified Brevibacterium TaxID=2614124 RepID=UPI001E4AD8AC|nr:MULTISPECIES: hypothetical protein [unclassified Brevibacterium]MCD1287341.1 hypothetical protein [Brevibacterium sp. CCUG 69071]MDK8436404.1 hypothetical protein [Brevibacterium sp. H-BE7]
MKIEWNDKEFKKLSNDTAKQFEAAIDGFNRSGSKSPSDLQKHMKKNGFNVSLEKAKQLLK